MSEKILGQPTNLAEAAEPLRDALRMEPRSPLVRARGDTCPGAAARVAPPVAPAVCARLPWAAPASSLGYGVNGAQWRARAPSTPVARMRLRSYGHVQCRALRPQEASGGDDVQQLCEAGEEEFLEIMALVGMASKPLHVRRLQKALQEWVNNPGNTFCP
ncbi:hypothetical protein HPB52_014692 [Rhipicephalus sanguineus]|uniref:Nab N-terminal domain-containing protein n=1 Tax=Rhipicephalus sanguineus TaxID=34632 RepID=A0A9D4SUH5_RHISA|nr:hypothetical protein HPB52_014692 [Rhipicephalus sanguineus]